MTAFSVLDLCPIREGGDAREALELSAEYARAAETCGARRFWLAEHHNMPGVASAATALAIANAASATRALRVGSGGIMLPNHAPLQIAEQFGTLEALYPGRIDLGVGRAPGADPRTAAALRRGLDTDPDAFPRALAELIAYLEPARPGQAVVATPGAGARTPVYVLGSSTFGAQLAAYLGLPFAFASHFAPGDLDAALRLYRTEFRPSERLAEPYVICGLTVVLAETDAEARRLASSLQLAFVRLRAGTPGRLPAPVEDPRAALPPALHPLLEAVEARSVIGSPASAAPRLQAFLERTGADELMVAAQIFDPAARARSLELSAELITGTSLRLAS